MIDVYKILYQEYGINEPILINEAIKYIRSIDIRITESAIRNQFTRLLNSKQIQRYCRGIYYIPEFTQLGLLPLSFDKVCSIKYITNGNEIYGMYTGLTLLNKLKATTQVPNRPTIITNKTKSGCRVVQLSQREILLKRAPVKITTANYNILKFVEILNIIDFSKLDAFQINFVSKELNNLFPVQQSNLQYMNSIFNKYPDKAYNNYKYFINHIKKSN